MLNGVFDFGDDASLDCVGLSRPLCVATVFGSVEVFEMLLTVGADLFQKSVNNGNILHSLVAASATCSTLQQRGVSTYKKFIAILDEFKLNNLLLHENNDGLRPLELAVNLGCLCLYECMQLTPGVYVTKTKKKGVFKEEWIDITEYETIETGNRRSKSPLYLHTFLDKTFLRDGNDGAKFVSDLVTLWMNKKFHSVKYILFVIILFVLLDGYAFFTSISKGSKVTGIETLSNITQRNCEYTYLFFEGDSSMDNLLISYLLFYSCISIIINALAWKDYIRQKFLLQKTRSGKKMKLVVDYNLIFFTLTITKGMYVLACTLIVFNLSGTESFINFLIVLTCITSVWPVLYFIQVIPQIGHFAMAMQRMVRILLQFIVLMAIIFVPFSLAAYRLLHGKDGCPNPEFSPNGMSHLYNTFILMLNLIDLRQFESSIEPHDYVILLFLHICFVFMIPILLINFLIALLSSSVQEVMKNKHIVMILQKIGVICQIEKTMVQCGCLRSLWKHLQSKHFHIVDGRYYIVRKTMNLH